jgi:hypothetical protein
MGPGPGNRVWTGAQPSAGTFHMYVSRMYPLPPCGWTFLFLQTLNQSEKRKAIRSEILDDFRFFAFFTVYNFLSFDFPLDYYSLNIKKHFPKKSFF